MGILIITVVHQQLTSRLHTSIALDTKGRKAIVEKAIQAEDERKGEGRYTGLLERVMSAVTKASAAQTVARVSLDDAPCDE